MARAGVRAALVLGLSLLLTTLVHARAYAQPVTYARVFVDSVQIHSGPGTGYRAIATARRGDTFEVRGRAAQGFWLRVALADARIGFVRGDAVETHVVEEGAEALESRTPLPWLFSPSSLTNANGELALVAGALGEGGMFGARGAYLLEPSFGIEASAGVAVASAGRLMLFTAGPILNLWPRSPVQLFATLQGGFAASSRTPTRSCSRAAASLR